MTRACLALDVGGTKIAAALVDESGAVLASSRTATEAAMGAQHVLERMAWCLDQLTGSAAGCALAGIGISAAGVIDPVHALVADATDAMPGWKGTQLGAYFASRYRLPVAAANDVHCALLGELWLNPAFANADTRCTRPIGDHVAGAALDAGAGASISAGAGGGTVAMLALGTGLGGAIASGGAILAGRHFLAGHFGRTLMWDAGAGRMASVESLLSGTGLSELYRRASGASLDGAGVMALADQGDAHAMQALDSWLDLLALQLHNLHWILDPGLLLLGGGVIDARALWWPGLEQRLASCGVDIAVAPAALGSQAGLLGAARLLWNAEEKSAS